MDELRLLAPAKLNLFLNILDQRSDGYHELQTVFQLLDLADVLAFALARDKEISIECSGLGIGPVETRDNLVTRAAQLLKAETGSQLGASIHLEKRIPHGAGLGGGSSDAATTLVGLNRLWNLGLSTEELAKLGVKLGADVPVFVEGRSAWAEGVGDLLQPIDLPEVCYVVLYPGVQVETSSVFQHPDLTRNGRAITIARFLDEGFAVNACESLVRKLYPEVARAVKWLSQYGPARMTGTGSCVFLQAPSMVKADEIVASVPPEWVAFRANGVNTSPLYT